MRPEDAPAVLAHLGGDREAVEWTAAVPWPLTEADVRTWIARLGRVGMRGVPEGVGFAVVRRGDGTLLGATGLSWPEPPGGLPAGVSSAVEVGYWIGREHWNRGYATEALALALGQARMLGARDAAAVTFTGNLASERVLEKTGFHRIGVEARRYPARGGVRMVMLWARVL